MFTLDTHKLIDPTYLFAKQPEPNSELSFVFSILFALAIVASGLVWFILIRREKNAPYLRPLRSRLVRWLFTTGLVGLFLMLTRSAGIPYFGTRFVLLLWLIVVAVWFATIFIYLLKKFPIERSLYQAHQLRERYLPKTRTASR